MAHTGKTGLSYFPFDIDFFSDEKIEFLSARLGLKGEAIAIRLLCKIYRNGYFLQWGDDESLLFAKRVGDGCQNTLVNDVVNELVKRGFLDESIFNRFKILTSKGIQVRFFEACERRKKIEVFEDILLVEVTNMENVNIISLDVNISSNNVDINPQSKVKNSKEKESKEKESSIDARDKVFYKELSAFVINPDVPCKGKYSPEMLRAFYDYWTEPNKSKTKMRFEMQTTWDLNRRLKTWAAREKVANEHVPNVM